jgi:N-acyl homoserine lactone hydrolase
LTVRPLHFCDVTVQGARWPVFGWAIERDTDTILVDTGMIDSTPELDSWPPMLRPWPELGAVSCVINTHLHFDHCGGNRRFAGLPTYVQRAELAASEGPDYVTEWARFAGATYVELDGDADLFPGVSVLATRGTPSATRRSSSRRKTGASCSPATLRIRCASCSTARPIRSVASTTRGPRLVYLAHHEPPWAPEYA